MRRKGAIELSANFIVVMIISLVVVVGGLTIFYKMTRNAQQYADTLDQQTQESIKQMMLQNSYRVAVYPSDPKITNGDALLIGVGVTNIYSESKHFTVELDTVKYYATSESSGVDIVPPQSMDIYRDITSMDMDILAGGQAVKSILLKMPKDATKGQYIYSIVIKDDNDRYGVVQVYVAN